MPGVYPLKIKKPSIAKVSLPFLLHHHQLSAAEKTTIYFILGCEQIVYKQPY
jgi:hypothetical protein